MNQKNEDKELIWGEISQTDILKSLYRNRKLDEMEEAEVNQMLEDLIWAYQPSPSYITCKNFKIIVWYIGRDITEIHSLVLHWQNKRGLVNINSSPNISFQKSVYDNFFKRLPNKDIKNQAALNKAGHTLASPHWNRLAIGGAAILTQPFIDGHNPRVDKDTARASMLRTTGKNHCLYIRWLCCARRLLQAYKQVYARNKSRRLNAAYAKSNSERAWPKGQRKHAEASQKRVLNSFGARRNAFYKPACWCAFDHNSFK